MLLPDCLNDSLHLDSGDYGFWLEPQTTTCTYDPLTRSRYYLWVWKDCETFHNPKSFDQMGLVGAWRPAGTRANVRLVVNGFEDQTEILPKVEIALGITKNWPIGKSDRIGWFHDYFSMQLRIAKLARISLGKVNISVGGWSAREQEERAIDWGKIIIKLDMMVREMSSRWQHNRRSYILYIRK